MSSPSPLKKRKTTADEAAGGARKAEANSLFAAIPDKAWKVMAGFSTPPDVYNLALTSKRFHSRDESSTDERVLATKILRQALLSSFRRVLRHSKSGINLKDAQDLSELPLGSVLISGSTVAQACLGVLWEHTHDHTPPDVDVFCTAQAAPAVRSWLVDKAGCMFGGFKDYRISLSDSRVAYTIDTKIHHVEQYGSDLAVHYNYELLRQRGPNLSAAENPFEHCMFTYSYDQMCEYGRNAQENYVQEKWENLLVHAGIEDIGPDYHIKPLDGHDLPFDFDISGNVDLIVAKKEVTKAAQLLEDFDLNICKASFDGSHFHIPDPHLTFTGKSVMEPQRKALVESYARHFNAGIVRNRGDYHQANDAIQALRQDHPNLPFYRTVDAMNDLDDYDSDDSDCYGGEGPMWLDPRIKKTELAFQFHNFCVKLTQRLQKYQARGVEIMDAPDVGNERFHEMSLF